MDRLSSLLSNYSFNNTNNIKNLKKNHIYILYRYIDTRISIRI